MATSNKIHEPVKNFVNRYYPDGDVTQYFAENKTLYSTVCNSDGVCLTGGHNGIDIIRPWGSDLLAVEKGIVAAVKNTPEGYGKHIRILSEGTNSEWTYGHLADIYVQIGDEVEAGDVIGTMGNTGFVVSGYTPFWKYNPFAGTHLHLGRRPIKFTPKGWRYNSKTPRFEVENYNNGFMGSVDFKSMLPNAKPVVKSNIAFESAINKLFNLLGIAKPKFNIPHTLKYGDRNAVVLELQKMLTLGGYFKVNATGYYGKETAKAVLQWQLDNEVDSVTTLNSLKGHYFGAKSLAKHREVN